MGERRGGGVGIFFLAVSILIRTGEQMAPAAGLGVGGSKVTIAIAPLPARRALCPPWGRGVSYLLGALHLLNHLSGDSGLASRGARAGL